MLETRASDLGAMRRVAAQLRSIEMAALFDRLLRVLPLNPIVVRIVQGGSRRPRHLLIRSGYLAILVLILLTALLGSGATLRDLAQRGASAFAIVSYGQVFLICVLAPVFMGGAIAHESNPNTWDVTLTTPLSSLQIVLGNLFGRLAFVLALLAGALPLFAVTQLFGGVPGSAILESYAIAAASALLMGSIAITLSATRSAGSRSVFVFYSSIVLYLFATYAIDRALRAPLAVGSVTDSTTVVTPLNPFLTLEALISPNGYAPREFAGTGHLGIVRAWMGAPIATQLTLFTGTAIAALLYATLRVRWLGAALVGTPDRGAVAHARLPRHVGHNPVAWREVHLRGQTPTRRAARWIFVAAALAVGFGILLLARSGALTLSQARLALAALLGAEVLVVTLSALNMSASAVSREREDKSLDILLTTPIQPGAYISGKLRGLIAYLAPLIAVPCATLALAALFAVTNGLGSGSSWSVQEMVGTSSVMVPFALPEAAFLLPIVLTAFVSLCVMIGLDWSVRSKGTIGSVVSATAVVLVLALPLGLCGVASSGVPHVGAVVSAAIPLNLALLAVEPSMIEGSLESPQGRVLALIIGSVGAGLLYGAVVYGLHASVKANFMTRVRRLAGTS